ncbi:MAG: amidohydrolase [Ignavibacteriaceae bacterium]
MKGLNLEDIINLRREIHQNPELSGREKNTSERIKKYIGKFNPDETITEIAGNGIAFIFKGKEEGKAILFRSELDALPIPEQNSFEYKSLTENVAHKCGHDGHMAILSGLASLLKDNKLKRGKIILLFQPAEETGKGAKEVLEDEKFISFKPDYVFALHNLPGFPINSLIIKPGIFASASKGLIVKLSGKTSHASEPENGISPVQAVASIMQKLSLLPEQIPNKKNFSLITIIHVRVGNIAFGTTPGEGELMATLRAFENDDLDSLANMSENIIKEEAEKYGLKYSIDWTEEFPSSINNKECVEIVEKCSEKQNLNIIEIEQPFRWSEDFGHFLNKYKGVIFGVGSGKDHPDLHNPDYDFPENIIKPSIELFYSIAMEILSNN